jgi:opacity protein-like surface antigen
LDEHGANQFFAAAGAGSSALLTPASDPETPFGLSGHKASLTGGGFLGYNYQYGRIVVGVEGDFAAKQAETSATATVMTHATYNGSATGDTASADRTEFFTGLVRQNWDASARLRLGGLITPSILLYGTGGVALGSVDGAFSYAATTAYNEIGAGSIVHTTFGAGSWNDTRIGWTAGLGVEAAIAAHWKVRAEYRFADLGHFSKTVPLTRTTTDAAIPNTGSSAAVVNVNADFHTLRLEWRTVSDPAPPYGGARAEHRGGIQTKSYAEGSQKFAEASDWEGNWDRVLFDSAPRPCCRIRERGSFRIATH